MSGSETDPHDSYVEAWRERWRHQREQTLVTTETRRAAALALLPSLVAALVGELGAARVWLVGSLARGDFGPTSDIDLAVEGIPPARWLEAEETLERMGQGAFQIEVVPIESARRRFLDALEREGRLLHGG